MVINRSTQLPTKRKIMMQSLKQLSGHKLVARDGDLGQVKDFYFDDHTWAVRYVVVDTGHWLPGRQVLLSPLAFGGLQHDGKFLRVNLTRKQIEDSPSLDSHKSVSRQYEEQYHRYYGWPYYWEGDGLWGGTRGFPILEVPPNFVLGEGAAPVTPKIKNADAHLRGAQAVNGYHLQATDGIVGHVCDFLMDDQSWLIGELVIKVGHRFTGKEVRIPTGKVTNISYDASKVFVSMVTADVERSAAYDSDSARGAGSEPPGKNVFKEAVAEVLAP